MRLDEAGSAARALADRILSLLVARHKSMFFAENDARGGRIDYKAVSRSTFNSFPKGLGARCPPMTTRRC